MSMNKTEGENATTCLHCNYVFFLLETLPHGGAPHGISKRSGLQRKRRDLRQMPGHAYVGWLRGSLGFQASSTLP